MKNLLASYMNTHVQFAQTDEITMSGVLVNVQSDYASLFTDDGKLIHYPYSHLKSVITDITELPKIIPVPKLTLPETFLDLLSSMITPQNLMIRIEHGKDSKIGVLSRIADAYISMVVNAKEIVHFSKDQIKNVSPVFLKGSYQNAATSNQTTVKSNQTSDKSNQTAGKSDRDTDDQEQQKSYAESASMNRAANSNEASSEKNKSYIIIESEDESKSDFDQNKRVVSSRDSYQNLLTKPLLTERSKTNKRNGKQKNRNREFYRKSKV